MEAGEEGLKEMCLWMTLNEKASTGYFCFEGGGRGPLANKSELSLKTRKRKKPFCPLGPPEINTPY